MAFRIPDPLKYEIRYQVQRFGLGLERIGLGGGRPLDVPRWAVVCASCLAALVLIRLVVWVFTPSAVRPFKEGPKAWFYDLNSGSLFVVADRGEGPRAAPSGPLPGGGPAGVRAHVYSYVLDPNASELFVGFLERPDSNGGGTDRRSANAAETGPWGHGRLIKRTGDKQWVSAASAEGCEILKALTHPNERGKTPIYQVPR
jgi:hypothetical protein